MPMYHFHLYDHETVRDTDGTDLADVAAAREHAAGVASELTFQSSGMLKQRWSEWTLRVHDDQNVELFSVGLADHKNGNSGK